MAPRSDREEQKRLSNLFNEPRSYSSFCNFWITFFIKILLSYHPAACSRRLDCLWGGCRTRTLSRGSLHFIGRSCISISSRRQAPTCVASAETRGHPAFMFIVQSNAFSSLLIVRTRDPKGGGAFVLGAEDIALPGGLASQRTAAAQASLCLCAS